MLALALSGVVACSAADTDDIDDGYLPAPNVEADPDDPTLMTGYSLVDAAKADNAVCLDGSPGHTTTDPGPARARTNGTSTRRAAAGVRRSGRARADR